MFPPDSAYSVTNGLAPAVAAAEAKDQEQEDHKDDDPPDPAPAAAAEAAAGIAATGVATAVVAKGVVAAAAIVAFVIAAAAAGRYLLFIHSKNLLNNIRVIDLPSGFNRQTTI